MSASQEQVGFVTIGRNEGDRLKRSLRSIQAFDVPIVYVDSGSSDDSAAFARGLGVTVVDLDMSIPFSAARARNEGFHALVAAHPQITLVQFVDGDCEVVADWLDKALEAYATDPKLGVVTGWREEQFPDASVYNAMCDVEWHQPAGEILACGGDMMVRRAAFEQVDGMRHEFIAGEDEEFGLRVGQAGWRLIRLPAAMTRHDANIHHFSEWWRRMERAGHAFVHVNATHPPHWGAAVKRIGLYGVLLPVLFLLALWLLPWAAVLVGAVYGMSYVNTVRGLLKTGLGVKTALHHAMFLVLSKFANVKGAARYYWRRWTQGEMRLIEYK